MRRAAFAALLVLPACSDAGALTVDGDAPPFGPLRSAAWLTVDVAEVEGSFAAEWCEVRP